MKIELSLEEKEELRRAIKAHWWRLRKAVQEQRNQQTKEEFQRRKECAESLMLKLDDDGTMDRKT